MQRLGTFQGTNFQTLLSAHISDLLASQLNGYSTNESNYLEITNFSLFASLISTISYLSWPGEIIKNGPMIMCCLLAYPLIGLVVGWFIVPFIMRLKVTSAYEILNCDWAAASERLARCCFSCCG